MMAYEEANYQVMQQFNEFEIRYYQERYVIQVSYANQNSGFQKLFNFIYQGKITSLKKLK